MAPIGCVPVRRSTLPRRVPRSRRRRRARTKAAGAKAKAADESVPALYSATGSDLAPDARGAPDRVRRLSRAADLGAAAGRLPYDPGLHVLSRRKPGSDGLLRHGAARTPVRPDARAQADAVDELRRRV